MREIPTKRGGGGQKLERVGFPAKNGDRYGDSALITTQGKSLESPCEAPFLARKSNREQGYSKNTQSRDSSSKILESQSVNKKQAQAQKSHREQLSLESSFEKSHAHFSKNTQSRDSSSKILESQSVNKKQAQAQKSHREQLSLESSFEKSHAHFLS